MKKKAYLLINILIFGLYYSCDDSFLEKNPPSSLTESVFFRTADDALLALNAVYSPLQLRGMYSEDYPKVAEVPSDDITLDNTSGLGFDSFGFSPAESQIDNVYTLGYEGIIRANQVIARVPDIEMDEQLKSRVIGEAKFLRALYYWHLASVFGEVPLVADTPENTEDASRPKSTVEEIYAFMIQELQEAAAVLPITYDDENLGRATAGAARALLGKVYLYAGQYDNAETILEEVISSGVYDLVPDYSQIIAESNENNVESIFEIQYQDVGGNPWNTEDDAGANESNLRLRLNYPNGKGGFGNLLPTQDFVDEFETGDPRLEASVFREGDAYDTSTPGEETFLAAWTPTGYAIKKGMLPFQRDIAASGINWPVIRFADVLLMYAEAANETGKLEEARQAVNRVRARVNMPLLPTAALPVANRGQMFEAIVHERRVELGFEYHRFNDLKRWGLAEQQLGPLGFVLPRNRFMPLPQSEVDTNGNLEQNPNY